jgi:predicted small metal-binding protein
MCDAMAVNKSVVRCECGYEVVARDEASLVAEIQRHACGAHGIVFTFEEALAVVLRSELEPGSWSPTGCCSE